MGKRIITQEHIDKVIEIVKTGEFTVQPDEQIDWIYLAKLIDFKGKTEALRKNAQIRKAVQVIEKPKIDKAPPDIHILSKENADLKKKLYEFQGWEDNLMRLIIEHSSKLRIEPLPPMFGKYRKKKTANQMIFDLFISDTHNKALIRPQDTLGLGNYNPDLYTKRMNRLEDRVYHLKDEDKENHGLDKMCLWMGGDLVEGSGVYPGQAHNVVGTELEQVFDTANDWINRIRRFESAFEEIDICFVTGNHSIGSRKKNDFHKSFTADNLIAGIIKTALDHSPGFNNVNFYWSDSTKMLIQRGDFTFCLNHGDDCKSWAGIPYYGIDRMVKKLPSLMGVIIDYHLIGHFHTAGMLDGGRVIMNGCVPGGSDLSINSMHVTSQPSQWLWYFHPVHGINRMTDIKLDDKPKLEPDSKGIMTPYNNLMGNG